MRDCNTEENHCAQTVSSQDLDACSESFKRILNDVTTLRSRCYKEGNQNDLTILDYSPDNALLFSQGTWSLIQRDLRLVGLVEDDIVALEDGPCRPIVKAFAVRRELVNYKKICLHLFEEAMRVEQELQQVMSYSFVRDTIDDQKGGILVQLQSLLLSTCLLESKHVEIHRKSSLLQQKRWFLASCRALNRHKGVTRALHDARDMAKAICLSPRHPRDALTRRPAKLKNMPSSMYVAQACDTAERQNPLGRRGTERVKEQTHAVEISTGIDERENTCHKESIINIPGKQKLNMILDHVRSQLGWSDNAVEYLRKSIEARGGYKALAIEHELETYCQYLSELPKRLDENIKRYENAKNALTQEIFGTLNIPDVDDEIPLEYLSDIHLDINTLGDKLSAVTQTDSQINVLKGALKACRENLKWVSTLSERAGNNSTSTYDDTLSRLFVVSDDVNKLDACAFVPRDFQLGTILKSSRDILDSVLLPAMQRSIAEQGWPPTKSSQRTRVCLFSLPRTDDISTSIKGVKRKYLKCTDCEGYFNKIWMRNDLCKICETVKRQSNSMKQCIFEKCKGRQKYFCPHASRCFVCDAPHSCPEYCRLTRGDGEVVATLVETIQPKLLLLDFDRTLCSTKSGASPLPHQWNQIAVVETKNKKKKNSDFRHSIDIELKNAIFAQQVCGSTHVVTRNSHKLEIEEFLRQNNLSELAKNVHIVPKKMTKGEFIKDLFGSQLVKTETQSHPTCIFIDDDIKELMSDEWLRNHDLIHRVLFVRAL